MGCDTSGSVIAANIYREDDAPNYRRGNTVLLLVACLNVVLYLATKVHYTRRNRSRDRIWEGMSDGERARYLATTTDSGNKRLDFRFAS